MNTRLVTAALVALLGAAAAPAIFGQGESSRVAEGAVTGDPRDGDCAPRCPPKLE